MNYKSLIAATAVATLPMMASATVVPISNGGTTNVVNGTIYEFDVAIADGGFSHTFTVTDAASGMGEVSLTELIAGVFTGLTVSWSGGNTGGANEVVTTEFAGAGSQTLDITWTSTESTKNFDGAVQISSVPVPAGLLLMGTALAGLGVMRRKKS